MFEDLKRRFLQGDIQEKKPPSPPPKVSKPENVYDIKRKEILKSITELLPSYVDAQYAYDTHNVDAFIDAVERFKKICIKIDIELKEYYNIKESNPYTTGIDNINWVAISQQIDAKLRTYRDSINEMQRKFDVTISMNINNKNHELHINYSEASMIMETFHKIESEYGINLDLKSKGTFVL